MVEAVVSTTLETLRDLLVGEATFLSGASDKLGDIRVELVRMKSFLKDADAKQHKDERVRNWVREVQDLCYRVEDVVETFAVDVASKRSGKGIKRVVKRFACLLSEGIALHKVGSRIARIQDRLSNLRTASQTYGIQELRDGEISKEANEKQWWMRQTYAHEVEEHFIGMQEEVSQLASLVVDNHNHQIISICGMGGLGKTTLARKIYHHARVKHCFESFAWCCISQQCNIKVVLQDILKQLLGERKAEVIGMNDAELVRELYTVQTEKKCLIVIDDIWERDHWEMLSKAFVDADQIHNKILLTTRNIEVAKLGFVYELRNLTQDEGWQLLEKKAFASQAERGVKRDPELEDAGRKIVDKCGGLPLAISALGGILRSRNILSEWQKVSKDVDLYLSASEGRKQENGSPMNVLALSYNDLPYNLKSCFLYMGIFREDEEIEARKLYHLWIAEGMVSSNHLRNEETMMDVAERHLRELASRSMVQVKIDNFSMVRRIESCNLHDLMRDLCLNKGKEERFLETFDKEDDHEGTCSFSERDAYRLAICCRVGKFDDLRLEQITKKYLRAVFVRDAILQGPPNFKSCRVVDFENCSFHEGKLPKEISKMVHLRYLGAKRCRLVELPSAIAGLQYIETLDLRTYSILNLPHNIFLKMKGLRHLYFSGFVRSGSKKLRLNGLSRLETLVGFDSERFRHKDLSEMVNIQYFDAKLGSDDWSVIIDHIDSWTKIKWVKIVISQVRLEQNHIGKLLNCQHLNDLEVLESPICKLPQYKSRFWPSLIRLCLSRTEIDEDSMEFLKKLPKLQELILDCYAFIGKEFICDPTDFHQLKSLRLDTLPNLEKWRMGNGALTNLSSLVIDNCMKLKIIPQDRLRYLRKLKELEIIHMPEEFRQQVWEAS